MRNLLKYLVFLTALWLPFLAAALESAPYSSDLSRVKLTTDAERIAPGEGFTATLEMTLAPGWHTYTDPPGQAGLPVTISWTLPEGFKAGGIQWPPHEIHMEGDIVTYGYSGAVALPVAITPPATLSGDAATLKAKAEWLICKDICIPETAEFSLSLPIAASASHPPPATGTSLLPALLLALAGGLILNLMPCVFPVLSLKCLAVAQQGGISGRQARLEGIAYTLGILASFGLIAAGLIGLQSAGEAIGWGYQMQSPVFVSFLALLLFAIGLNLSGVFTLPVLLGGMGRELTQEPTLSGSFLTGVLATLVAAPCTAPFMAAAVGYALTQPALVSLLIFETLGLGLALPFLLVSFLPRLRRALPRPGRWMESFKEFLAFPMYLSAVWLAWVLARQAGPDALALLLATAASFAFVVWIARFGHGKIAALIALLVAASALYSISKMNMPQGMLAPLHKGEAFSEQRITELRTQGKGVFVDATAAWCLTCQVNYRSTLGTERVRVLFKERDIAYMVADWTRPDPAITAFLKSFGYRGVPLYVYYPPKGEPRVLPQVLTPGVVEEATASPEVGPL